MHRCLLVLATLALVVGCASSPAPRSAGSGDSAPEELKLEKVWFAPGFVFRGYEALYVAETRAEVPKLNPDGAENLEWARGVVRDEVAAAIRTRSVFPAVVTREADLTPGTRTLRLEHTIVEYEKGGGGARFFAGLYGAGQPVIKVAGRITEADRKVFRFEARRKGESGRARWLGGYLSDKDIQTEDIRDLAKALADLMARPPR